MTRKRSAILCPREPIGLRLEEASAFVGASPNLFRRMVSEGQMPCPYEFKSALIWDAEELIAFLRRLPRKALDLKPGVNPPHDEGAAADEWDSPQA